MSLRRPSPWRGLAPMVLGLCVAGPAHGACGAGASPGFHVAPAGSDRAAGTASAPFASLARAQLAMRQAGLRTTYVEDGIQALASPLVLGPQDHDITLVGCSARGARLDGGGRLPVLIDMQGARGVRLERLALTGTVINGTAIAVSDGYDDALVSLSIGRVGNGIVLAHTTRATVRLCHIAGVSGSGIELKDGSDDNVLDANTIEDVRAHDTSGGGIFLHGASRNRVTRNLVRRTRGMAIGISNWDRNTINTGDVVTDNILRDVDLDATDSGAIYILGRSQTETGIEVAGNLVDGAGSPARHTVGIYLDDSTSGVRVHGNILRRLGAMALELHGGSNNLVERNVLDLGHETPTAVLFQAAPADTDPSGRIVGNIVRRNVIVSVRRPAEMYVNLRAGSPLISDNLSVGPAQAAGGRDGGEAAGLGRLLLLVGERPAGVQATEPSSWPPTAGVNTPRDGTARRAPSGR